MSNPGKDTLKITSFYSACRCTDFKLLHPKDYSELSYVLPGKSVLLEVNYAPDLPIGLSDTKTLDILTLFTNVRTNQKLSITLSADIEENDNEK